jgi:hypothetical protein
MVRIRAHVENFARTFRFSDQLVDEGRPQITIEDKRAILAGNYARLHGLDLDACLARVKGDESRRPRRRMRRPPCRTPRRPSLTWSAEVRPSAG